jgi:hypothetical protein
MTIPKGFSVKFRFPILYGLFFGLALLICFPLGYTQYSAAHPNTDLTIYLLGGVKITASSFDQSNEEMYYKLCDWLERYSETFDPS